MLDHLAAKPGLELKAKMTKLCQVNINSFADTLHTGNTDRNRDEITVLLSEISAMAPLIKFHVDPVTGDASRTRSRIAGGFFALSTPNRYSLSPEPHVNVWGVGYLPRSLQARYVKFVRNRSYSFTRLLSVQDAKRLFSGPRGFEARVVFPVIPEQEISNFTTSKKRLALIYNWLVDIPLVKLFLPFFGAYYRVLGNIKN